MLHQGQNYKVNRKVKEDVDKNQINYRESSDDPISIIKRVYIYITDKKGHILPEVTLTIDGVEVKTAYNGLLISNFPNAEKTITAEKEGYKPATATVILNAEIQTHEFFLALETDDDESEVISTDDTKPKDDELVLCNTLFKLSDNNTLVSWGVNVTNEIVDGVYTGRGSYIEQGWSNEGLWQIDYDIKYNTTNSSYVNYYVGVMPFCSEEINPYTNEKKKNYCMESWEKSAAIEGLDAILIEGPNNYKYSQQNEYQHVTVKKTASDKIEYYFDNNKWVYSVPKLQNLETLHFGYRDNPSNRGYGVTISTKDLLVRKLCSEPIELNTMVEVNEIYEFESYGDEEGETKWGEGTVQIKSLPENEDDFYIEVEVKTNSPDDSFVGQTFYILKNATVGNKIYPLYSDNEGTETGIYVVIGEKIESETELETPEETYDNILMMFYDQGGPGGVAMPSYQIYTIDCLIDENFETLTITELSPEPTPYDEQCIPLNEPITLREPAAWEMEDLINNSSSSLNQLSSPANHTIYAGTSTLHNYVIYFFSIPNNTEEDDSTDYDIVLSTDKETLSLSNNESAQISVTVSSPSIISNYEKILVYDSSRIEYENGFFYFPIDCLDTAWHVDCVFHPTPDIVDANKEIVISKSSLSNYTFGWENDSFTKTTSGGTTTSTISEISRGFTGFLKYDNAGGPDNNKYQQLLIPKSYFGLFYELENIEEKITFSVDMIKEDAQLKGFILDYSSILPYTSNTCTITKTE